MSFRSLSLVIFSSLFFSACQESSEQTAELTDELPAQTLELNGLEAFQPVETSTWQTAGSVFADRNVSESLQPTEGEGVLVHLPEAKGPANLTTTWEHGDIDLSLEFMLPKDAQSGLYLQGRYGLQLTDSWGQKGDFCGSIASNSSGAPPASHTARLNACRAPGLWQHLEVKFRAPQFDAQGKKTAGARLEEVLLNGTKILENVALSGPTPGAVFTDETSAAPLMIQGNGSPVAFKNIRYKTYDRTPVKITDLQYTLYSGIYHTPSDLEGAQPTVQRATDSLSFQHAEGNEKYALVFEGNLMLPRDGEYLFTLQTAGPSWLYLDGEEVTNNHQAEYMEEAGHYRAELPAGVHPFRLVYTKNVLKWVNGIALYCEGPQLQQQALQTETFTPSPPDTLITLSVENQPIVQRGFMYHQGEKKTHSIAVGLPAGLNYAVDMKDASLLSAWGGDFVDVTDMWYERGHPQTAQPLGNPLELSDKPAFARLNNQRAPWPDSIGFENAPLQPQGYSINGQGIPVFHYQLGQATVDDYLHGGEGAERKLVRNIDCTFSDTQGEPVYCLLAEGSTIEQLPDGSYAVDGKKYYLTVDQSGGAPVQIRTDQGQEQLLAVMVPQPGKSSLQYSIIW